MPANLERIQQSMQILDEMILPGGSNFADIFRLRGLRSGHVLDSDGKAYKLDQADGGNLKEWDNVPFHSFVVCIVTDILSESTKLPQNIRAQLNTAALFHDSD